MIASGSLRTFVIGFVCAVAYFVIPILLGGLIALAFFLWFIAVYICLCVLAAAVTLGIPFGLIAWVSTARASHKGVRFFAFLLAGAVTALVACGIVALTSTGIFWPFAAFGAHGSAGVAVLVCFAAVCSALGWLTADRQARASEYQDALGGHTFEELADLLDHRKVGV